MITKTYRSKSDISVNVVMPSGKSLHVAFTPVTGGGSTFTTSDECVQRALEGHYRYGKMFKVASTQGVVSGRNEAKKEEKKVKQIVLPKVTDRVQAGNIGEKERSVVEELLNQEDGTLNIDSSEKQNEGLVGGVVEEMAGDGEVADDGDGSTIDGAVEEAEIGEQGEETDEGEVSAESDLTDKTVISVSCPDDAKEYLVEKFGISRTKLRWLKQIKEQAEANGILFEGI